MSVIDRDEWVYYRFDRENRDQIRALVTEDLVAEHAANPIGVHSDQLQRVLAYFRRGLVAGKYIVIAEVPFAAYRIGILNGERGNPIAISDEVYPTENQVLHAIFVRRLHDIGALS